MKFTQLTKSLQQAVDPAYLIEGEEAYFRDAAVKAITEAVNITQPLLNNVRYEGESLKGDRLLAFRDELYTLPFFDEKRIVRVYGFYPSEREWESVLAPYFEKPCSTTVLLIVNEGKKANAAELKKKKNLTFVDCSREDEETLSRWLFALMRRKGLEPDADACALMVRFCARDASRMKAETDKFVSLLGEGERVTREHIEEYVTKDAEYKIYEMTQAASRGNFAKFQEIADDLMKKGFDEHALLSSLTSHFETLTAVSNMKGGDEEIAKALSQNAYAVKKNREAARRLGKKRVQTLYEELYALSSGAKSGVVFKQGALFLATAKIFFGGAEK